MHAFLLFSYPKAPSLCQKPRNIMPIFAHHYQKSLVSNNSSACTHLLANLMEDGWVVLKVLLDVRTKPDRHLDEWAQWKTNHCQKTLHE